MHPIAEQTILVTGTTSGLGRALVERLAPEAGTVLAHGRDEGRLHALADRHPNVVPLVADLADQHAVDDLADQVAAAAAAAAAAGPAPAPALHALVNNAGIGFGAPHSPRQLSTDGIELRLAVNYLAAVRLTRRLLPLLRRGAPSRVVNVASIGQQAIDFDDPFLDRRYSGVDAYRRSKLAMVMHTFDLAGQLRRSGVTVNAVHPASMMPTKMVREGGATPMSTLEEGLEATVRLITDPALDGVTGRFFDGTEDVPAHRQAYDGDARRRLGALTDELLSRAA